MRGAQVLRGGTERCYAALAFNADGSMLSSVGSYPDYLLTLWDWRAESIVLRSKAFSQEVFGVAFSPYFEGQLTTSGTGHIRFWRMAATFTGLKLQGAIGKFGTVELTDVAAFVELPDGKVRVRVCAWSGGASALQLPSRFVKAQRIAAVRHAVRDAGSLDDYGGMEP